MGVFDLLDRVINNRNVLIGYLCVLTLAILLYLNGSWINESLTWTGHGWIRRQNYWEFREPTTVISLSSLLFPISIYLIKKWCTECYIIANHRVHRATPVCSSLARARRGFLARGTAALR